MANWHDITRDEEYQSLSPQAKLDLKQRFFERTFGADKEFEGLSEPAKQALFQNFMQTPDDTGQGYISSMAGSAARGFGEVVPGTIEGVGALTGIQPIREAGQAVRSGLEYIAPVNPLYQEDVAMKLANVGGNIASVLATGGVGGAAGRALSAERIAAGASQAARQQLSRQAVERGAKAALYGTGAAQGAAEGATEAERYGMTGGDAYLRTLAGSIGAVGAEALPFGTALETALPRRLLGAGGEAAQGIRRAAATEGVEEMGTQFVGNVATEALAPEGVETPGLTEGLAEAGALGAFGGALFGGIGKLTQFDKQTQIQRDLSAEAAAMPVDSVPDQTDEEKRANMEKGYQLVVDPEGKTAYVPQQVSPEVLAGLSPQEQADLGFTPPAAPTPAAEVPPVAEEPPPVAAPTPAAAPPVVEEPVLPQVANDTAIRSFENVEANADVAPATAAVLEEIALNENTPEVALETEASGVVPTVPQEGVASSGEIPVQETELTGAAAGSSGGGMKRDKSKTEQMTLDEATERVWPLNKNTQYAPKDGVANLNGMPAVKSNGAWMFTHPTFGRSPVLSPREISRLDHQLIIQDALSQKKPVAVESVDWYDVPLPLGYTRQDDLYVYKPQPPTPNAPTEIPIQESLRGEPQGGTEIRQRQEAGTGNRVLGAAPVQAGEVPGQVAGPAAAATAQPATPAKPLTEAQARDILTKRFGKQVADKMVVAEFPAVALREGEQPVEVDAFLQGGKVHLNLKFIDSEEMLVSKAEHEMAHAVWSNPNVQKAWSALRASMPEDVRQRITKNVTELGYNLAQVDEETMVRFFEDVRKATPPSKWQAFMDAVINAFRQFFGFAPDARTARLAAAKIIAEAESAVARGLDPVSAAFGASIPQAVLDNLDADYMAAVERGDMAAAQRMVDEAAKAAGYNVGPVFHGTNEKFNQFKTESVGWRGIGAYFGDEDYAKEFGGTKPYFLRLLNPTTKTAPQLMKEYGFDPLDAKAARRDLISTGYDGIVSSDGNYAVFDPNQIKSADPITRDEAGNVIPLSQRFDLRSPDIRYSLRQQDRLRSQDWRMEDAAINLQERRPQQETINEASKIIGDFLKDADDPFLARRKAFQFLLSDPNLRPETRVAGLGLLAQQMDMVANLKKRAGRESEADLYDDEVNRAIAAEEILKNDPTSWQNLKFDIDAALANYSRDGALMLNILNAFRRLTPEGFVRRMERAVRKNLDETTTAETGRTADELYSEIARIWQLMREAGPGKRGEAIAAALKSFMPQSISVRRIIDAQTPQAGFREQMEKEGEQLVRNFFQMIAGPRDPKGPLAEFNSVIQNAISDSLRRAMEKAGLLKKNESLQMTDIDKMVRAVSVDPLRLGKLAKADEAMQAELNAIEDPERRATLQQAWDEAMARMATTVAPESVVRRAVNAELKDLKINWNEFFDKNGNVSALRDKVVKSVLDKVAAKLNIEGVMEPGGTGYAYLGKLQDEIKNAFDFAKEMKRQSWLAYREEVEVRRRIAERKTAFLEALKNQKVAESSLARIAESLAGPPKPGQPKNPVNELVQAQIKSPSPDFVENLKKEGVSESTAKQLEEMIEKSRQDAAEAKPFLDATKAVEQFIKSLGAEPTKRAVDVLTPLARKIVTGATGEALNRADFQEALAKAFNVPVLTKQQADEFTDLVRRIRALPEGVLQDDLKKELNAKVAMFDGIPAVDMLMSVWYSNILSGPASLFLQLYGGGFNSVLKAALSAISSNPVDTVQAFRGALTSGLQQALNEAKLAMQGRSQFKPTATTDRNTISNLEILSKYGPQNWTDWLAWIGSSGTLTKYVFRLFTAIDTAFQAVGREWMAYSAASRAARKVGKIGSPEYNAEFIKQVGGDTREFEAYLERAKEEQKKAGLPYDRNKIVQRAYELRSKDRPADINRIADRFANQITFTNKPEGIGRVVSAIISAVQRFTFGGFPLGRLLLPFNQIISSMFEQSLDYTPIGFGRAYFGGHLSDLQVVRGELRLRPNAPKFDMMERRQRAAAATLGTFGGLIVYALSKAFDDESEENAPFRIYNEGPPSKAAREAMPKGWSRGTIKLGDYYFKYTEIPFSTFLGAIGALADAERYGKIDEKSTNERLKYLMKSFAKGALDQGVLSNLKKTFEVLVGDAPLSSITNIPVSTLKGAVPFSGLGKEIANIADPTKISDDDMRAAFLRDIPYVKGFAGKPDLNRFGEPVKFEGLPVVRRVLTPRVSDHVSDWMGRNFLTIPGMGDTIEIGQYFSKDAKNWIQRKALQMGAAENGIFTTDQKYRFEERAGKLTKAAIESLMTLKKNPRPQERAGLQKVINREVEKARKKAMLEIVKEDYL